MKLKEVADNFKVSYLELTEIMMTHGNELPKEIDDLRRKAIDLVEDVRRQVRPDFDIDNVYEDLCHNRRIAKKAKPYVMALTETVNALKREVAKIVEETRENLSFEGEDDDDDLRMQAVDDGHMTLEPDEEALDANDREEGKRATTMADELSAFHERSPHVQGTVEKLMNSFDGEQDEDDYTDGVELELLEEELGEV